MKRVGMLIVAVSVISLVTVVIADDFRKMSWGMSCESVVALENQEPSQEGVSPLGIPYVGFLLKAEINEISHELLAVYYFVEDQCYFAKYVILTKHSNPNDYLSEFKDFQEILTKRYGLPVTEVTISKTDLWKDAQEEWGLALEIGDLEKHVKWQTETTTIHLRLIGNNFKVSHQIRYMTRNKDLLSLVEAVEKQYQYEIF